MGVASILEVLAHPQELVALVQYKLNDRPVVHDGLTPTMARCYELLNLTSRSFAAVIQRLDGDLRAAICIFYLVLRGLDTIEDDMTIEKSRKIPLLREFHTFIGQAGWTFRESGPNEKDAILLVQFDQVVTEFLALKPLYRETIADITKRMGAGMSEFLDKEVVTKSEWDLYCHYVAGLVGIGLAKLFSQSGMEDDVIGKDERLANSMGLFLQKVNIIRDYREDIDQGRIFWPREVWSKYARELGDFKRPENRVAALACLNELITDALHHIPDVFTFMSRIRNQSIFNFCAIPQVMAVATLALCFNNYDVFQKVVKIRKGLAVTLITQATSMQALTAIFADHVAILDAKIPAVETPVFVTRDVVLRVRKQCLGGAMGSRGALSSASSFVAIAIVAAMAAAIYMIASAAQRSS